MFGLGIKELFIIALVILLIFSFSKIPNLIKNVIESIRIVKEAYKGKKSEDKK